MKSDPPEPPIDLAAWKAARRGASNNFTPEELEVYTESLEEADEFWNERSEELFSIALEKFPELDPADIVSGALEHFTYIALNLYRLEPGEDEDKDTALVPQVAALIASLRFPGSKIVVYCRHELPHTECAQCVSAAKVRDAEALAEEDEE